MAMTAAGSDACIRQMDEQPKPELKRKDVAARPLGAVGNLQYTARQGGTARASRIGVMLSGMRGFLIDVRAKLKFFITRAPQHVRTQRAYRVQVHKNSRLVGDLLGSLTAAANDKNAPSAIIQRLKHLGELTKGDLSRLPGAKQALAFYVAESTYADLKAVCDGVLSADGQGALMAAFDQISPDRENLLRNQALGVLLEVKQALRQRSDQLTMQEPVSQVARLLSASPLNGEELHSQLSAFPEDEAQLQRYLEALPNGEPEKMLFALRPDNLQAAWHVLPQVIGASPAPAVAALHRLHAALESEVYERIEEDMHDLLVDLDKAVDERDPLAVSAILLRLNAFVEDKQQVCGTLPKATTELVCTLVNASMRVFRDAQNNPAGPLNKASLAELDNVVLRNLKHASSLHPMGLDLDPNALNEVSLSRVRAQSDDFVKASSIELPMDLLILYRQRKLTDAVQALLLIDDVSYREQAEALLERIRT